MSPLQNFSKKTRVFGGLRNVRGLGATRSGGMRLSPLRQFESPLLLRSSKAVGFDLAGGLRSARKESLKGSVLQGQLGLLGYLRGRSR
jgi:hypothetical protein